MLLNIPDKYVSLDKSFQDMILEMDADGVRGIATILPKGHGELIDRSKLSICPIDITDLPQDKCLMVYLADDVDNAEVIIAADRERKDASDD